MLGLISTIFATAFYLLPLLIIPIFVFHSFSPFCGFSFCWANLAFPGVVGPPFPRWVLWEWRTHWHLWLEPRADCVKEHPYPFLRVTWKIPKERQCKIPTLKTTCNFMFEVVQVSQDTQKKSEKAVALLPPRKLGCGCCPRRQSCWLGGSLGSNSHWEWNPGCARCSPERLHKLLRFRWFPFFL